MIQKKQAQKATSKKQKSKAKTSVKKNTKQTHDYIASISSKGIKNPKSLTPEEIKKICASNMAQSNPRDGK